MFWAVQGANRIIAFRCSRIRDKFEDFWEHVRLCWFLLGPFEYAFRASGPIAASR
jgi:hypothetical protein